MFLLKEIFSICNLKLGGEAAGLIHLVYGATEIIVGLVGLMCLLFTSQIIPADVMKYVNFAFHTLIIFGIAKLSTAVFLLFGSLQVSFSHQVMTADNFFSTHQDWPKIIIVGAVFHMMFLMLAWPYIFVRFSL